MVCFFNVFLIHLILAPHTANNMVLCSLVYAPTWGQILLAEGHIWPQAVICQSLLWTLKSVHRTMLRVAIVWLWYRIQRWSLTGRAFTCSSCFCTTPCCSVTCLSCSASSSGNSLPAFLAVLCLADRAFLDFLWAPIFSSRNFCCIWSSCWVSWSHSSYWALWVLSVRRKRLFC